ETNDVVVTVPQRLWLCWLAEGDLPGDPPSESGLWDFSIGPHAPPVVPGARVYVAAHGFVRGYAPLVEVQRGISVGQLVRAGGGARARPPARARRYEASDGLHAARVPRARRGEARHRRWARVGRLERGRRRPAYRDRRRDTGAAGVLHRAPDSH